MPQRSASLRVVEEGGKLYLKDVANNQRIFHLRERGVTIKDGVGTPGAVHVIVEFLASGAERD